MARHTNRGLVKVDRWTPVARFVWLTRYDTGAKIRYEIDQFADAQIDAAALAETIPGHTVAVSRGDETIRFYRESHADTLADVAAYLAA